MFILSMGTYLFILYHFYYNVWLLLEADETRNQQLVIWRVFYIIERVHQQKLPGAF